MMGFEWPGEITPLMVIIAVVVLVLLVVTVVLVVRWRRKRSTAEPRAAGPSVAKRLRSVWSPFYARIPRRARHFPTFVVVGEAGVGKTHLIDSRVDWRGQANQYSPSAYHDPALQLYLGSEVIVHELSAPLLRDVSARAKRALVRLWRNLGPSATVVVVVDARSLATTPPDALRTLAQLVRGKIGLFPRRVAKSVDVRVCLTHLDQVAGYEEFAAVVGTHEKGLDLSLLGPEYTDADALIAAFDGHLAHALTTRTADEFARLVRFYDALAALVRTLPPLLTGLRGESWYDAKHPPSELYLGSIIPHSYVGDPFEADPGLVVTSIERYNRRTLAGAITLGAVSLAMLGAVAAWHLQRVQEAEDTVSTHTSRQDRQRGASAHERHAAQEAAEAIEHMFESELLWLRWVQIDRKHEITDRFEHSIRQGYLMPWLEDDPKSEQGADRVTLLYAVSLMYATSDGELGWHIKDNARWWANELGLTEQIVTYYVKSSRVVYEQNVELPERIDQRTGREWLEYREMLCDVLARSSGTLSPGELEAVRTRPQLRSKAEYEALEQARQILLADDTLAVPFAPILGELDTEIAAEDHGQLAAVAEAIVELSERPPPPRKDWGLGTLVVELEKLEQWRTGHQEASEVIDQACQAERGTAVNALARTRAHELIGTVLGAIPPERKQDGRSFFDLGERPSDTGAIRGYGGGATETIDGHYTKEAFEDRVAPVLRYGATTLPLRELEDDDRDRLQRFIKTAIEAYASKYRDELITYWLGFEFDPGSKVALPFALKGLTQTSSWFTDFLTTVTRNVALPLADDEFHAPLQRALKVFEPLQALLAEEEGAIAGLEPYTAIIAGLLPLMEGTGGAPAAAPADDDGLEARLSGLGLLALQTAQGKEVDRRAQVTEWLEGARIDYDWHEPFDAPVELVYRYGLQNVEDELERAWEDEVRPVVRPLLATYPFDGAAEIDARVGDIEAKLRQQGKEPGEFWVQLERLAGPAMVRRGERLAMLDGIPAPMGMLEMIHDIEDLTATLWDADGKRVPLTLMIEPQALPTKEHDGRVASMAYLSAGGSAVYAFNQRPEPQALVLRWWDQGEAIVSLTMTAADDEDDTREHTLEEVGSPFSFYRLLDRGRSCMGKACRKKATDEPTLTEAAIAKGTRCSRWTTRGTTNLSVTFSIPVDALGKVHRLVRFVLRSDPWAPFAVRDCR